MTDSEIVKALEESISFDEPYESDFTLIRIEYIKNTLDLINRQKAEIERLKGWQDLLKAEKHSLIKAEAYKEFAEKMKGVIQNIDDTYIERIVEDYIDNLLKELVGENNETKTF